MKSVLLNVWEIVASHSAAVTASALLAAALVLLVLSGIAGRFAVLFQDRFAD